MTTLTPPRVVSAAPSCFAYSVPELGFAPSGGVNEKITSVGGGSNEVEVAPMRATASDVHSRATIDRANQGVEANMFAVFVLRPERSFLPAVNYATVA